MKIPWKRSGRTVEHMERRVRAEQEAAEGIAAVKAAGMRAWDATHPEPEREPVFCFSPNGGFRHDDTGGPVPRPACHGGARRYIRAETPDQVRHAAALEACPHCAKIRGQEAS